MNKSRHPKNAYGGGVGMHYDRPGLLLMWHGDFPDGFLVPEKHMAIYQKCLFARDVIESQAFYDTHHFDDDIAQAGLHIVYHLLSRLKPGHLELSFLSMRSPGIRQAIYRATSRGAGRIICTGAAGLMLPGHGASESIPAELKKVLRDNPALDLVIASPALDGDDVARLIQQSLEFTLHGRTGRWKMPERSFRCLEDLGIVLVCCHDFSTGRPTAVTKLADPASQLSEMSREACGGKESDMSGLLHTARAGLMKTGFHAVESGFMDFALPDVGEAARRLLDAGCTHIVAAGMPALLHRHPYSFGGPSESIERLKKAMPETSIVYIKPDPEPIAPYLADVIMSRVLEADENGIRLKDMLRNPRSSF
jgi:sirohydrochlorin ferrochelatase